MRDPIDNGLLARVLEKILDGADVISIDRHNEQVGLMVNDIEVALTHNELHAVEGVLHQ